MAKGAPAVVVGLSGGLGNQMFQYAAGRALSLRLNVPLQLDLSWFAQRQDRAYSLAPFAIEATERRSARFLPAPIVSLVSRVERRLAKFRMGAPIFRERHFHFDPAFEEIAYPAYLEGYWQSPRYFSGYRETLLKDFALKAPLPEPCQALNRQIADTDAICVHVRRGDYVSNPVAAQTHGLCAMDYYLSALTRITEGIANPHCFIFSDDPDWVRGNFNLPWASTVVDVNQADDAHWDIHLMATCKHFVIANSSLSWWAAWLGQAEDKKVIAPAVWFRDAQKDTRDLIPAHWQRA